MNVRTTVLFLMLILSGVAAGTPAPVVKAPTLAGDPRLPAADLEALLGSEQWKAIGALPYRAFVIFDTQINADGTVTSGTIQTSQPDATWSEPARKLAKTVRVKASGIGSHIPPTGELFVIFYGQGETRRALIYARQTDFIGSYSKGRYLGIEKF